MRRHPYLQIILCILLITTYFCSVIYLLQNHTIIALCLYYEFFRCFSCIHPGLLFFLMRILITFCPWFLYFIIKSEHLSICLWVFNKMVRSLGFAYGFLPRLRDLLKHQLLHLLFLHNRNTIALGFYVLMAEDMFLNFHLSTQQYSWRGRSLTMSLEMTYKVQ